MKKFKDWCIGIAANLICIVLIILMVSMVVLSIANKMGFRFVIKL